MKNTVTVIAKDDRNSQVSINSARASELNLTSKKKVCLSFGINKHYADLNISDDVSFENIIISKKLVDELNIPTYPIYEIKAYGNEIVLGPFIGLLMAADDKRIKSSFLNKMLVYVSKYSELHGLIAVFALNKVDKNNRLIEGYCYNPVNDNFESGVFPYPCSIYRTIGLNASWKNHFLTNIGDKVFNNQYFSKWKMFKWFSVDAEISDHIPDTVLFESSHDVFDMLGRYEKIYIKPISGLKGVGIYKVSKENDLYTFRHRDKFSNYTDTFKGIADAEAYINNNFNGRKYLIQGAINLMEYNNRLIDYRCIMQKDQSNNWVCNAIIGKCGVKNSIVSNISSGGEAFPAKILLRDVLGYSEAKTDYLLKSIESFAIKVCLRLDEFGINCGTLGLDVGLDINDYIWLIEINNRDPAYSIALDIHDNALYHKIKTNPMFYAKYLAGF